MAQEQFPKGTGTSYGELAVLGDMFEEQLREAGINPETWHEDLKCGCWLDFVQQYEEGCMEPKINLEGV